MVMNTDTRHHVPALVDQLTPVQLAALEGILQSILEPEEKKITRSAIESIVMRNTFKTAARGFTNTDSSGGSAR